MLLAKAALGFCGTLLLAGAYTFHEGIMRVDVDNADGHHVHVWIPSALVPMALYVVPAHYVAPAAQQAGPWLPTVRVLAKELEKYPDSELVDVREPNEHVRVHTSRGKLLIDVEGDEENVHVQCPLVTLEHVSRELRAETPTI